MDECSNKLYYYNLHGHCQAEEDIYNECEDNFLISDEEDIEDYAFSDYDCEAGLFTE